MSLVDHAEYELASAGLFNVDADYDGEIGLAVIALIRLLAAQRHSGHGAAMTIDLFTKLASFKPLTPLTSNPDEWIDRTEESGEPMWQSKRSPSVFSRDGGKTWYDLDAQKPRIVCLCGSTRFYKAFQEANYRETMDGKIVLSVGFYPHAQTEMHGEQIGITPEQKHALDELHKRKIDLADEILVLNVGGYIGESTRSEVYYAVAHNKLVRWLEEP